MVASSGEVSHPAPPALGRIGRYQIYEELAEGGMARVFLAQRDGSPRLCVLKQLHGDLEEHGTASIRFQREAHLVSQLDHPNIARVIDAGLEDGKFCIAMDLIEGCTVHQVLETVQGPLPARLVLGLATEVLAGLAYAHTLRGADGRHLEIVHRDLSPKNVMLTQTGEVKIIDFGVAQGRIDSFRTAPGMMVGTLLYMSPEQALTEKTDHRSDLYSLSIMLWELFAGQPAVRDGKAVHVLDQVVDVTPRALHLFLPELPRAVSDVVMRGLAKDPEARWQSAGMYRDALLAAGRPVGSATPKELGELVRELFPPDRQPYARWSRRLPRHIDGLADAPTIADSSLTAAYDPFDFQKTPPLNPPPLETQPTGSEITRPDTPAPTARGRGDLSLRVKELERAVARQRQMIILLAAVSIVLLGLFAYYRFFPL
jgi:serine/threonine protein kinase